MKKLSILTILFLSIIRAQPGTEVPGNMSFQGFLTDSEGVAYVDGEYNLNISINSSSRSIYGTILFGKNLILLVFLMVCFL